MRTTTFCQEVGFEVPQDKIAARVDELKTLGGALDAYSKSIGEKRYICAIYQAFDERLDDVLTNPDRESLDAQVTKAAKVKRVTLTLTPKINDAGLLTGEDYAQAAARLGCDAAIIRAVAYVESGGKSGFLPDGRPKILFESHVFSKLTSKKYDVANKDISTAVWTRNYQGGAGEYDRLHRASELDRDAALKATSWGKFQILGMNYERAGFQTIDDFVNAQYQSEQEQLSAFVMFILSHDLSDELRDRRWADFARRYNGPRYDENHYDVKMASAYSKFSAMG